MTKDNHQLGKFEFTGIPPAPRGVPQIAVAFEVDANGILQVSAEDKGTGKSEKITITSDKGRLSDEEIERMVREAEEFAEEDKSVKDRVDARNGLEGYAYNLKNALSDEEKGIKANLDEDDAEALEAAVQDVLDWLDENQEAELEEYQAKLLEAEGVVNPLLQKGYSGGDGGDADDDEEDRDEL